MTIVTSSSSINERKSAFGITRDDCSYRTRRTAVGDPHARHTESMRCHLWTTPWEISWHNSWQTNQRSPQVCWWCRVNLHKASSTQAVLEHDLEPHSNAGTRDCYVRLCSAPSHSWRKKKISFTEICQRGSDVSQNDSKSKRNMKNCGACCDNSWKE